MTFHSVHEEEHCYFITATIAGWKRLFDEDLFRNVVLDSFSWLRSKQRIKLYAFVVMPHHLHAIIKPLGEHTIHTVLQQFGSFTAHEFLNVMRDSNRIELLEYFQAFAKERRIKQQHNFWEQIQAKNVYSLDVLRQKMEYIHNNPVAKQWNLANERWQYKYSSACFYDNGMEPIISVDDAKELFE